MSKQSRKALVWLRNDLRLDDNPALNFACENYDEVFVAYLYVPREEGDWAPGAASKWWLHHSLKALSERIAERGGSLGVFSGDSSEKILRRLLRDTQATGVFWNRRYEFHVRARDEQIKRGLGAEGFEVMSFNAQLLWEPWEVSTGEGKPYQVFTPFWKKVSTLDAPSRPRALSRGARLARFEGGLELEDLNLLPKLSWASEFSEESSPGELGGARALQSFLKNALLSYKGGRDVPSQRGTSRISPHLHFGELSIRKVWHLVSDVEAKTPAARESRETYLKELAWREFAYHILFHFPETPTRPLREAFSAFPWRTSHKELSAWKKGLTGYPIVDAGMRELWRTGYMHNRVRMIVASFLVKDLRISWLEGAKWFWDTLLDADLASNTLGWQWAGGCGADAAPYFRVFNPTLQGEKFDADADYVRRWVPELSRLSTKWIHRPWEAPPRALADAGVMLGKNYPLPMVDHKKARSEALAAFSAMRGSSS